MNTKDKLEISSIDALLEDYNRGSPINYIAMYAIPSAAVGAVSGFVGGLISYLTTRDPAWMAYGAHIGFTLGALIGFFSSQHVAEGEYMKLCQKKQQILNQDNQQFNNDK